MAAASTDQTREFDTRHVLDYRPEPAVVSKHRAGRVKPLTRAQRTRASRDRARLAQDQKSATIDASKLHMMLPG